jgi:hypothetical protein
MGSKISRSESSDQTPPASDPAPTVTCCQEENGRAPTVTYCQGEKSENGSFLANMKDRFYTFTHASKDEHKACLNKYMEKVIF